MDLHSNEIGKHVVDMATIFNDVIMHSFILLMSLIKSRGNLHTWINVKAQKVMFGGRSPKIVSVWFFWTTL